MAFLVHQPLPKNKLISLIYHSLFEYPLTQEELENWSINPEIFKLNKKPIQVLQHKKYFLLEKDKSLVKKRLKREKASKSKLIKAKKAADLIAKLPTVLFVGATGSLAMNNSHPNSDIDLLIITKKNRLWLTRPLVYLLLWKRFLIRKHGEEETKDALCLNMWLEETNLRFPKTTSHFQNLYISHEILQIKSLVNKQAVFEEFLFQNRWVSKYWHQHKLLNKIHTKKAQNSQPNPRSSLLDALNLFAFKIQYKYMKSKISNETVSKTRALFHPIKWSDFVEQKLKRYGIYT